MLLIVNVATLMGRRDGGQGLRFDRKLFRHPVRTRLLVAGRFFPTLLGATFMVLSVGLFMRLAVGAKWPLLGPLLFTLACLAWLLALGWTFGHSWLVFIPAAILSLAVLLQWLMPRLRAYEPIARVSLADGATLLAVVALAYAVAMFGADRDRGGTPVLHFDLVGGLRGAAERAGRRLPTVRRRSVEARLAPIGSPLSAQIWMDWREKGWMLPMGAAAGVAVTFAMGLLFPTGTERTVQSLAAYPVIGVVLVPPVVGFLYGRVYGSSERAHIDPFRARFPLRDEQLARAFTTGAMLTLIATWVAGGASVAAALLALRVVGDAAAVDAAVAGILAALSPSSRGCSPGGPEFMKMGEG